MKKQKSILLIIITLIMTLLVLTGCASSPKGSVTLVPGENMLDNGNFDAGQDPWTPWIDEGWGGAGEVIWADGIAKLVIDDPGTAPWAVAMHYKKLLIEKGEKYVFSFKMKSDENRVIRTGIGNGLVPTDPPYLYYQEVEITTEWQTYTFEFKMPFRTDKFGRIDFNCALNTGEFLPEGSPWTQDQLKATSSATVYIDDVELRKMVPESAAE
ncbi:MAG: carbohydrate binding domain-containing protein [Spirochaetaceae bacterium]|nr:carbohydrate binding domain-containing protein [Spirochaetaceae bacterium]